MSTQLDKLREQKREQEEFIEHLVSQAESEDRDLVDAELKNIQNAEERLAQIEAQAKPLIDFEKRRASMAILDQAVPSKPKSRVQVIEPEERDLGTLFVESEQFRSFGGRGTMEPVRLPEFRAVGPDPLLTTTDPFSKMLPPPRKVHGPEYVTPYPLLRYVGRMEVSTNSLSWWVSTEADGAEVVPEGDAKPPITWSITEKTFTLQTVAGWFKFSRQAAQDIPMLRDIVNQKIRQAIDKKLNELALAALTGAKVAGNTTTGAQGVDLVAVVRESIAKLQATGRTPTAVMLNPADAAAFDVLMLGKPLGVAQVNGGMWGLPIIPVPGLTAGTAIVGDISEALIWFYKTGLELYLTDSDVADAAVDGTISDFRRNILTALGEVRGVFGVADASAVQFAVFTPKP